MTAAPTAQRDTPSSASVPTRPASATVYMLVYNTCTTDSRVLREAKSVASAGYHVTVVALAGPDLPEAEYRDGFCIVRVARPSLLSKRLRGYAQKKTKSAKGLWRRGGKLARKLRGSASGLFRRVGRIQLVTSRKNVFDSVLAPAGKASRLMPDPDGQPEPPDPVLATSTDGAQEPPANTVKSSAAASKTKFSLSRVLQYNVVYFCRVWKATRAAKPDVLHANDLTTLPVACVVALLTGAKVIYDSHEIFLESASYASIAGWRRWIMSKVEEFLARRVAAIITVNEAIANELCERYGVRKPVVLMNCCESTSLPLNSDLRRLLDLPQGVRLALYVGSFAPERGLPELVRSSRYLDEDTQIVLLGYGSQRDALCEQVRIEGLEGRVHILGPVRPDEVVPYAAGADVAVAPIQGTTLNHFYCTPNKVFEYLMAGLPIVASRLPEMARIVAGHGVGILCDPYDPRDIAMAINAVLNSPDRKEMAERARQIAEDKYNWEMESRRLLAVYDDVAKHIWSKSASSVDIPMLLAPMALAALMSAFF